MKRLLISIVIGEFLFAFFLPAAFPLLVITLAIFAISTFKPVHEEKKPIINTIEDYHEYEN